MLIELTQLDSFDQPSRPTAIAVDRIIRLIPAGPYTVVRCDDGQIRVKEDYPTVLAMCRGKRCECEKDTQCYFLSRI